MHGRTSARGNVANTKAWGCIHPEYFWIQKNDFSALSMLAIGP